MLTIRGSRRSLCDGLSRREFLRVGGLGALGLGLADVFAMPAPPSSARPAHFGRANSCILLFLYGSPPQDETFDPQPDAPQELRVDIGSIAGALPGLRLAGQLPRL